MKDPKHREMMADVYRLYERFEVPSGDVSYWDALNEAAESLVAKWQDPLVSLLCVAVADAIEQHYKQNRKE